MVSGFIFTQRQESVVANFPFKLNENAIPVSCSVTNNCFLMPNDWMLVSSLLDDLSLETACQNGCQNVANVFGWKNFSSELGPSNSFQAIPEYLAACFCDDASIRSSFARDNWWILMLAGIGLIIVILASVLIAKKYYS